MREMSEFESPLEAAAREREARARAAPLARLSAWLASLEAAPPADAAGAAALPLPPTAAEARASLPEPYGSADRSGEWGGPGLDERGDAAASAPANVAASAAGKARGQ
jgi:hypothetical protein